MHYTTAADWLRITEVESVYSAVRTEALYKTYTFSIDYILLGVAPASELSESTFRNLVSVPSSWISA
jgi:hypothetical protein